MTAELISPQVQKYLERFVPPRPVEMQAMEDYAWENDFPIISPAAGYFCYQIGRMIGARQVFELGSGYGYSTAWFAKAVQENGGGTVHHVVWEESLSKRAWQHLSVLGYEAIVKYHVGEAVSALRQTPGPFDLIFNDIDKEAYPQSMAVIKEKLRSGGVLIVDNLLWYGRIFDENDRSSSTEAIRELVDQVINDSDWIASVAPVGDGLLIAYKR